MKIFNTSSVRKKLFLFPLLFVAGLLAAQLWSFHQEELIRKNVVFKDIREAAIGSP